jgi:NADP-dependent 3-hydroxy acid dehydrogenase YdfG
VSELPGVIVVVGAAHGIGAAIAERLASGGATVVIADLDGDAAAEVAARLSGMGLAALWRQCDVRSFDDAEQLFGGIEQELGPVRALVAAAGIAEAGSLLSADAATWRPVLETNVLGVAHLVRACVPLMAQRRAGHIVVIGSTSGLETYVGEPVYCASKWAVTALVDVLRKETASLGIRVTLVAPGLVDTRLSRATPLGREELGRLEPLQPDDVARAVEFALAQPPHVVVGQIVLRPMGEE